MKESKTTIQRQTKRFVELTTPNFEYYGENYTVIKDDIAANDETKIMHRFFDETLVTELKIKLTENNDTSHVRMECVQHGCNKSETLHYGTRQVYVELIKMSRIYTCADHCANKI